MKIIKLEAENFKKIKAVEIKPDGNTVMITGKNGAGKSSVLDAIMAALCGKKSWPNKPVRDGEKQAKVVVDLGEYVVTQKFTEVGGSLSVVGAKGLKATSPQALLDRIVGKLAFDPMAFCQETPKNQRQTLMDLVGLTFVDLDKSAEGIKAARSFAKMEKERLQHQAEEIPYNPAVPKVAVSASAMIQEYQAAIKSNAEAVKKQDNLKKLEQIITHTKEKIAELQSYLVKCEKSYTEDSFDLPEFVSDEFMAKLKAAIANIDEQNTAIQQNQRRAELLQQAEDHAERFSSLGREMKEVEGKRATRLSAVKMPVEGLTIGDGCVFYEGLPLVQVNSAKQIEIGVAVAIGLNPDLRVMRMDGNNLDSDSLAIISKMVKDNDYQAWIEKVDETGEVGIYIEDGEVK